MSNRAHTPGMGWWPPKLRLKRSDLCSECASIDFMAAFTPPQDYDPEEEPWTLLVERERLVIDSNCPSCRSFSQICYSIDDNGNYFIVFYDPPTPHLDDCDDQRGNETPPLDTVLISVLRTHHLDTVLDCFDKWMHHLNGVLRNSGSIICHLNKPVRGPATPQIVPRYWEVSLAKSWLERCTRRHQACRCAINTRLQMPRTRLIDCVTRKLINVGAWPFHRPRFAALSYRWGMISEHKMEQDREGRILPNDSLSNLPLTIEDAITVTKDLGLRYLWVDQYCIDQNNSKEKQAQVQKMDRIYQCAEVTIMATAGGDCHYGLPGVSKRARQVLDPFILDDTLTFGICPAGGAHWKCGAWDQRGWTFQEAHLSRRRLIMSDTLAHFECTPYELWQRENFGGFETVQHSAEKSRNQQESYITLRSSMGLDLYRWCDILPLTHKVLPEAVAHYARIGDFDNCILEYLFIVSEYTTRKLSYASDGLNAFLGLANAMQNHHHPVYNVGGVPFLLGKKRTNRDYWAEATFSSGLGWASVEGMDRSDQQDAGGGNFPSWSWANIKLWPLVQTETDKFSTFGSLPCWYRERQQNRFIKYSAQLRGIQIEFTSGNERVIGLVDFADMSRKAKTTSPIQPTALIFTANSVPCHAIGIHSEIENTDEDDTHTFRAEFCHDVHGRRDFRMSLIEDPCNETNSDGRSPQADSEAPAWAWVSETRGVRLLVHERKFHDEMNASGWSLLLLRCVRESGIIRLLIIHGMEGNTARRVGIINVVPGANRRRHWGDLESLFLRCCPVVREVRLV